jgi:hypothetical protein
VARRFGVRLHFAPIESTGRDPPGCGSVAVATPKGRPPAAWWVAVRVYCRSVAVYDGSHLALDSTVRSGLQ